VLDHFSPIGGFLTALNDIGLVVERMQADNEL
jgi:hypothetical protein